MNAKEKAKELVKDYYYHIKNSAIEEEILLTHKLAKICALKCCDEVLGYMGADRGYNFWTSVRAEIKKL